MQTSSTPASPAASSRSQTTGTGKATTAAASSCTRTSINPTTQKAKTNRTCGKINTARAAKQYVVPELDELPESIRQVPSLPKDGENEVNPVEEFTKSLNEDVLYRLFTFFDPSEDCITQPKKRKTEDKPPGTGKAKAPEQTAVKRSRQDIAAERRIRQKERNTQRNILEFHKGEKSEQRSNNSANVAASETTPALQTDRSKTTPTVKKRWLSQGAEELTSIQSGIDSVEENKRSQKLQKQLYKSLNDPNNQSSKVIKAQLYKARQRHEQGSLAAKTTAPSDGGTNGGIQSQNSHSKESSAQSVVIGTDTVVTVAPTSDICRYYLADSCTKGDKCPFSHSLKSHPCRFYHAGAIGNPDPDASGGGTCKRADNCTFSHQRLDHQQRAILELEIARLKECSERSEERAKENASKTSQQAETADPVDDTAAFT